MNRIRDPLEPAYLRREYPLWEQMRRDLTPIPGRVSTHVPDVVTNEVGGPWRNPLREGWSGELRGRFVGPTGALERNEGRAGESAKHRPLMEDVARRYRHERFSLSPVRWATCRLPRLSTIW
jgi:hypothetical protein